jgi:hypothetical protein
LFAHWTAHQNTWILYDRPVIDGKPVLSEFIRASSESVRAISEAARYAVSQLRQSNDPKIRATGNTLRDPLHVWLDLMRVNDRGFRKIQRLPSRGGGTENGHIYCVFEESAGLWDDIIALGRRSDISSPDLEGVLNLVTPGAEGVLAGNVGQEEASGDVRRTQVVLGTNRAVTVIRDAGTASEFRWDTYAGGDFKAYLLFHTRDRVKSGDEVHCELFDAPRIIARVDVDLKRGGVWNAPITTRTLWNRRYGQPPVAQVHLAPNLAPSKPTNSPPVGEKGAPVLNQGLVNTWIADEGWTNETLAKKLKISERAVSSLRNNGEYHGFEAVTKLANLMGREIADLCLPPEAST